MTLTEMRYIVALARERHFGKAAAACHVSQPTLSTQLKKLEDFLGVSLFERTNKSVQVTAIGARNEVFQDVGDDNNAVNPHNGVNWYFSTERSWGYAPAGQAVNRNSCDTQQGATCVNPFLFFFCPSPSTRQHGYTCPVGKICCK